VPPGSSIECAVQRPFNTFLPGLPSLVPKITYINGPL
jgi:hypothetical protein